MTPAVLKKVVYAGTHDSFAKAAEHLLVLAEVNISSQRIRRWTELIGNERAAQTATAKTAYEQMTLPARRESPAGITPPQVACVQMDGGRMQIRQRKAASAASEDPPTDTRAEPLAEETCAIEESTPVATEDDGASTGRKGKFWKESKVGCLLSITSKQWDEDPFPKIPEIFVDPQRMKRISSEIKGCSTSEGSLPKSDEPQAKEVDETPAELPKVVSRSVVASKQNSPAFGLQLAAAAYRLGFHATLRKAFVCDGQSANWKVWEQWFSHYTPIVDFVHAVCYVYAAAMAGVTFEQGWKIYVEWAQWLWGGEVEKIISALSARQQELGCPAANESKTSPRSIVAQTLTYLVNQGTRMNYPEYRKQGLPTTSSYIESTIKQINRRVKGTEKFWDRSAEAILHLSADYASPKAELARFWDERPKKIASYRTRQSNPKLAQHAA